MACATPGRKPNRERHHQVAELRRHAWTMKAIGRRRVVAILQTSGRQAALPPVRCSACGAEVGPRRRAGVPAAPVRCLRCLDKSTAVPFAQRLRTRRLRAGLTQRQLADRRGLARSTVAAYERGAAEPTAPTLKRLVEVPGSGLYVHATPRG
jgi:DNA-binding XRE family transcriptional regulator